MLKLLVPTGAELVFALKAFSGAMLALYIAFRLGLDNPYWSMATAYIVAQPLTGALRSKARYRFVGTFLGGTAAVTMVPNLVNAPVLLSLAMAAWIGMCLYLSLLDRSPRAYLFMLAGYTAGIIGFPGVASPQSIFETALTRVEEISIGIACTSLVGSIVFPRPLGPVLAARIVAWIKPATDWAVAALAGQEEDAAAKSDRRRLAAEAADIGMMTSQLAYDVSHLQTATRHIERQRLYILSLMPVLSSIGDRVVQLRKLGGITPGLQSILDGCSTWIRDGDDASDSVPDGLLAQVAASQAKADGDVSWAGILRITLLVRLTELVTLARHARAIRHHVLDGAAAPEEGMVAPAALASAHQVKDHGMALLSASAAGIAVLLVCSFWIAAGWSYGAGAAVNVAVACSFFAAQDDPAPAIQLFARNTLIALIGAGFYILAILPRIETFPELMLVLLPAGLVIGVLISRPATFGTGMLMGAVGSSNLALNNGYTGNLAVYLNNAVALLAGLAAALIVTKLIRSVGAAWSAERLLRAGWRDIAAAASVDARNDRARMTGVMTDRLGLLMPRLAAVSTGADLAAADALADLRVGLNVIGLQSELSRLPVASQGPAAEVLSGIARHYRGNPLTPPPEELLHNIDGALNGIAAHGARHREALMMLVGLRSLLFAGAPAPLVEAWA